MSFWSNKLSGIKKRLNSIPYGLLYFRDKNFSISNSLTINKKKIKLKFIDVNNGGFKNEFTDICLNDCYHLHELGKRLPVIKRIVDVGANQGIFLVAARQHFAAAIINCYEPNSNLQPYLSHNAGLLNASVHYAAVTKENCRVTLHFTDSDLATTTHVSDEGNVQGIAFSDIVSGEPVDIIKLDCEGAEWDLLADIDSWKNISTLALEYHLWAKQGSTREDILAMVANIGFEVTSHRILSIDQGIIIAINKSKNPA